MGAHEWAFYGWKEGAGHKFYGPKNITDLWHVKKIPPQQLEHLTGKLLNSLSRDAVFVGARRERPRPVRWQWLNADRR